MSEKFDPGKYLSKLKGGDYLEVKFRLLWLRMEHPDADITTDLVQYGTDIAVVKAHVAIPGRGSATGYGSETPGDFRDYLEKAETKAIGRALGALGFGTQFTEDFDEGGSVNDSPVQPLATKPATQPPAPPKPPAKAVAAEISQAFEHDMAERDITKLKAQITTEHERQGLTGGRWANYILEHLGKPGKALNADELRRLLLNLECDAIKAKLKLSDNDWVAVVDSAIGVDVRPPSDEQTVEQWSKIKSCLVDLAAEKGVKV